MPGLGQGELKFEVSKVKESLCSVCHKTKSSAHFEHKSIYKVLKT